MLRPTVHTPGGSTSPRADRWRVDDCGGGPSYRQRITARDIGRNRPFLRRAVAVPVAPVRRGLAEECSTIPVVDPRGPCLSMESAGLPALQGLRHRPAETVGRDMKAQVPRTDFAFAPELSGALSGRDYRASHGEVNFGEPRRPAGPAYSSVRGADLRARLPSPRPLLLDATLGSDPSSVRTPQGGAACDRGDHVLSNMSSCSHPGDLQNKGFHGRRHL